MSLKVVVSLCLAYGITSILCSIVAWVWLTELNPSFPIVPLVLWGLALACAATAGKYWTYI